MLKMQIEGDADSSTLNYFEFTFAQKEMSNRCHPFRQNQHLGYNLVTEKGIVRHNLSPQQQRLLKGKQEKNILAKIQKIVQEVVPIHEAEYESQNENDMSDLIEQIEHMDIQ